MPGLINNLISVISEQASFYEDLVSLGTQKKEYIIQNDVEALRKVMAQENAIVGKAQRVDRARADLMHDIAGVLNEKESELTLSRLAEIIREQSEHKSFVDVAERLRIAADTLKNVNEQNKLLLQNALEYIDFTINLIRSTYEGEPAGYMPGGETPGARSFLDVRN